LAIFEVLILPLQHNGEEISRFLGAFVAIDPPSWIGITEVDEFRVIETELTCPADDELAVIPVGENPVKSEPPVLTNVRSSRIVRDHRRQFRVYEGGLSPRDKR